jgi:predicted dehydrogenase
MLNIIIIGCGAVTEELHAAALKKIERSGKASVAALVDPDEKRIRRMQRWFPSATGHRQVDEAYPQTATPRVTLVASPPGLHRRHVEQALEAGSHVLCEKPFTPCVRDSADLKRLGEAAGVKLAVGMTRRFFPSLAIARRLIHAGTLGWPLTFACREGSVYAWPITSDAPFRREVGGGGVLLDKGVHVLDTLLWLFGPMQVEQAADDAWRGGVEGNCQLRLANARTTGTVSLSWDQNLASGLHVRGPLAELKVNPDQFRYVEIARAGGPFERLPTELKCPATLGDGAGEGVTPATYEDCIWLQWVCFLRAVLRDEPVPVDPAAAVTVTEQIESAYRQMAPMRQPWLGAAENEELARRHWTTQPLPA